VEWGIGIGSGGTHLRMMGSGNVKRPSLIRGAAPGRGTVDITGVSIGTGACGGGGGGSGGNGGAACGGGGSGGGAPAGRVL